MEVSNMIDKELLESIISRLSGKISKCVELVGKGDCSWDCCFYDDSYLLFLPGEWESAQELGYDLSQYDVLDANFHGGVKAVPKSKECCVPQGVDEKYYKSIDCRIYPYWFEVNSDGEVHLIQGDICPIIQKGENIERHRNMVASIVEELMNRESVAYFLKNAKMIGYSQFI